MRFLFLAIFVAAISLLPAQQRPFELSTVHRPGEVRTGLTLLARHPDGNVAYLTGAADDHCENILFQVDPSGSVREVTSWSPGRSRPTVMAFVPGGVLLFDRSTHATRGGLHLLDSATLEVTLLQEGMFVFRTALSSGKYLLYDSQESGSLLAYDAEDRSLEVFYTGKLRDQFLRDNVMVLGNIYFFEVGRQLFRSDGTAEGTYSLGEYPLARRYGFTRFGDEMVFTLRHVNTSPIFRTLVFSDGSRITRQITIDEFPGSANKTILGKPVATANGLVVPVAVGSTEELRLVRTDGTAAGSYFLEGSLPKWSDPNDWKTIPQPIVNPDGKYIYRSKVSPRGLYLTDGSVTGTRKVAEDPFPTDYRAFPAVARSRSTDLPFYFSLTDPLRRVGGERLYVLNAEEQLTQIDLRADSGTCEPRVLNWRATTGYAYFVLGSGCPESTAGLYRLKHGEAAPELLMYCPPTTQLAGGGPGTVTAVLVDNDGPRVIVLEDGQVRAFPLPSGLEPAALGPLTTTGRSATYLVRVGQPVHGESTAIGNLVYRLDWRDGEWGPVQDLNRQKEAVFSYEVVPPEARGRVVYVRDGSVLYGHRKGRGPEALVENVENPVISALAGEWVIVQDTARAGYWRTDGAAATTLPVPAPPAGAGRLLVAGEDGFYTLGSTASRQLALHRLAADGLSYETRPLDAGPASQGPPDWVGPVQLSGELYFVRNGDGRTAVLYRTHWTTGVTERVAEFTAPAAGLRVIDLRAEAGVLRYEWAGKATTDASTPRRYYLYDPGRNKNTFLYTAGWNYPRTVRVGADLYLHDTTKIYTLRPGDDRPVVIFDYEVATASRSTKQRPFRIYNLTAHRDGTLLFHRGTPGFGLGRIYPDENYRRESFGPEAHFSYRGPDTRPLPIIGDELLLTRSQFIFSYSADLYGHRLYNLSTKTYQRVDTAKYYTPYRGFATAGNSFYFIGASEVSGCSSKPKLFELTLADRDTATTGTIFADEDGDGIRGADEAGIVNLRMAARSESETRYTFTDSLGHYAFALLPEVEYTIAPVPRHCYAFTGDVRSFTSSGRHDGLFPDIGLRATGTGARLLPTVTSAPTRCGFTVGFSLTVTNEGCTPGGGQLELVLPGGVQPAEETGVRWEVPLLAPYASYTHRLSLVMPGEERVGDTLTFLAVGTNADGVRDTTVYRSEIRCAIDPNDKLVSPARRDPGSHNYTRFDEELTYTIRFQNTGNDTAFTVRLEDRISKLLDLETFRPVAASHPYSVQLDDHGVLEVLFADILLPDSTVNEPRSHGFFTYRIAVREGVIDATVENEADIFFDFNAPIRTNRTANRIVETLDGDADGIYFWNDCDDTDPDPRVSTSCKTSSLASQTVLPGVSLFPNPSTGAFRLDLPAGRRYEVVVTDLLGHRLRQRTAADGETVDLSGVAGGIYLVTVTDPTSGNSRTVRLLKR